jgi:hypothetical protein
MERYIPLTDEQHERLWIDRNSAEMVDVMVGNIILQLADEGAKRKYAFWKSVDALADRRPGEKCSVDWVNRCIIATPSDWQSVEAFEPKKKDQDEQARDQD